MPATSQKNMPLSAAGADLGLTGDNGPETEETDDEKKKRLAAMQRSSAPQNGLAVQMLLGSGVGA